MALDRHYVQQDLEEGALQHKVMRYTDIAGTSATAEQRDYVTVCNVTFSASPSRLTYSPTEPTVGRCPDCFKKG